MALQEAENSVSSFDREYISDSMPEISNDSMATSSTTSSTSRRVRESSRLILPDEVLDFTPEMLNAYKIIASLMSTANKHVNVPFLYAIDTSIRENSKYNSVIKRPIWLDKVRTKLLAKKYESISQVVRDVRLILENCYRFYGPAHGNSKKAMKLEVMLEQKLALLPRDLKQKTSLELTSPELVNDKEKTPITAKNPQRATSWKENSSVILSCVRKAKAQQERDHRRQLMEEKRAEQDATNLQLIQWEEGLVGEELAQIKTMWELPQIGHFFFLAQSILNIPEVSQFELERAFLMPASSSLLATIMTSLLSSPAQRNKLDKIPPMPYRIWQNRLCLKVRAWYKTFNLKERCLLKVFEITGVEPEFFRIMGLENPLEKKQFHELTLKQRIWLVKGYCDYCLSNHKSIQEGIFEGNVFDQKEYFLGEDRDEHMYINFPQFCGQSVRVYKQFWEERPLKPDLSLPLPVVEESKIEDDEELIKKEEEEEDKETETSPKKPRRGRKRKRVYNKGKAAEPKDEPKPREFTFELVAESVNDLRDLAEKFANWATVPGFKNQQGRGAPRNPEKGLYNHLKNLVLELEPWEQKLEQAEKKSRYKLKKEWETYRKRIADNIPEVINDFWNSDGEEDVVPVNDNSVHTSRQPSESEPENLEDLISSTAFRQTHYRRCTKRQQVQREMGIVSAVLHSSSDSDDSDSSSSDSYHVTVSSRGRIRRTRNFGFGTEEKRYKSVENAQKALDNMQPNQRQTLEAHRNQNSADDAKMQYQWETMRQKLLTADSSKAQTVMAQKSAPSNFELVNSGFGSMKAETVGQGSQRNADSNEMKLDFSQTGKTSNSVNSEALKAQRSLPPYQPKIITKRPHAIPKPLIFRKMPKDGGQRIVQTTFSRPGVLKTTVSTNTNISPAHSNVTTTTLNTSYLQKTVQSSPEAGNSNVTTTLNSSYLQKTLQSSPEAGKSNVTTTLNSSYLHKKVQSSPEAGLKMVSTTISNVLPTSALGQLAQSVSGGSGKKVFILPVQGQASAGKTYVLKVLPGGKGANLIGRGVGNSTSGTTLYTIKNPPVTTLAASDSRPHISQGNTPVTQTTNKRSEIVVKKVDVPVSSTPSIPYATTTTSTLYRPNLPGSISTIQARPPANSTIIRAIATQNSTITTTNRPRAPGSATIISRLMATGNATISRSIGPGNSIITRPVTPGNSVMSRPVTPGSPTICRPMAPGNPTMFRPISTENNKINNPNVSATSNLNRPIVTEINQLNAPGMLQQRPNVTDSPRIMVSKAISPGINRCPTSNSTALTTSSITAGISVIPTITQTNMTRFVSSSFPQMRNTNSPTVLQVAAVNRTTQSQGVIANNQSNNLPLNTPSISLAVTQASDAASVCSQAVQQPVMNATLVSSHSNIVHAVDPIAVTGEAPQVDGSTIIPSSFNPGENTIPTVKIFSDGTMINLVDGSTTSVGTSGMTFINNQNIESSGVPMGCIGEPNSSKTSELVYPSQTIPSEVVYPSHTIASEVVYPSQTISLTPQQMDTAIMSTVIGHQQFAPTINTVQSIISGSGDFLTLAEATQMPIVSSVPVSNEQQISYGVPQGAILEQQVSPIINIGGNLISQNSQTQAIRTMLGPVQMSGGGQTLQFITNPQIVTEATNQNMVLCSSPLLGNTNGFLKTANLLTTGQGNMFVLTNTGQIVSLSGGSVDGTIITDNVQAL